MAKKKIEELKILENPATNVDGGFNLEITENDIQNFPELGEEGILNGDKIFISNEDTFIPDENLEAFNQSNQINEDFISQDKEDPLLFYINELLVSLEGIFIGGHASQKRDQLIEYLNKR